MVFFVVAEFYLQIGQPYGRPMLEDLPSLAETLSVDETVLNAIAPRIQPCDPALEWRFQWSQIDPVCPNCIAEGQAWRQHWRHSLVSACDVHKTVLLDRCPRCKTTLSTTVGGLKSCECGLPFEAMVVPYATEFETWVAGLMACAPQAQEGVGTFGPWSEDAPGDFASFLFFLASNEQKSRSGKEGKTPLPATISDTRMFLAQAEP